MGKGQKLWKRAKKLIPGGNICYEANVFAKSVAILF